MSAGVIALPWLRGVDCAWLADAVGDAAVVTIDNHYLDGGQGATLPATLRLGLDRVPACGRNDEVLRAHGLDAAGIAAAGASAVIVASDALADLAGKVAMVDGGFDPIHDGHVRYFAAAAALGVPVLCNLSPDSWVATKHPPLLTQDQRAAVLDAFRDIAYVHISAGTTVDVLERLRPRYYAKGEDWRGRLPEAEQELCARVGIEVVYLDTVTNSSTALLSEFLARNA